MFNLIKRIKQHRANKRFQKSLRWWSSSSGHIELQIPIELAESTFHSGSCDDDVYAVSQEGYIQNITKDLNPDIVRNVLDEYAAWDDEELKDKKENIQRLLWIACSDIAEQEDEVQNPVFN
jgi:hypothetical protein